MGAAKKAGGDLGFFVICASHSAARSNVLFDTGVSVLGHFYDARNTYQQYQQSTEARRQEAADKIAYECSIMEPINPAFRNCISEKIRAYQEQSAAEQDLQAQQDMAYWAAALFLLTAISTMIGIVGLALLFVSLRQTRQAISIDREVGHAQVRAYLSVVPTDFSGPRAGAVPEARLNIVNKGQTPARKVRHLSMFEVLPHPLADSQGPLVAPHPTQFLPTLSIHPDGDERVDVRGESVLSEDDLKLIIEGKTKRLYLAGMVIYDDVFERRHTTMFCFSVVVKVQPREKGKLYICEWEASRVHNDAD